ncbi:hypothetical protein, partial [Parabacteroides distasonis]|uniref:hypothetical protein n=1 Tax=Parabacteroides distasonis TaxID=823 RepID=UPI003FD6EC9D
HFSDSGQSPKTHIPAKNRERVVNDYRAKFKHLRENENRPNQLLKLVILDYTGIRPVNLNL